MIRLHDHIEALLHDLARDFIAKHHELGMKATGDWEQSVSVHTSNYSGVILANDYTEYLTKGREDGGMPPVQNIEKWVNAKLGIIGKEANSMAWAIAKTIENEGTTWHQQGGSDLIDGVLTAERERKMIEAIGITIVTQISTTITRTLVSIE